MKSLSASRAALCLLVMLSAAAVPCLGSAAFPEAWFFPNRSTELKDLEGKRPPDLQLDEWIGDKVSVSESKGKVVVIDFWATWCGPCMAAIPENVQIVNKYKDQGLVFIGVHNAQNGWDKAPDVVKEKKINYSVALDKKGGASAKAFSLAFWPTYVVIDRQGMVRGAGLNPKSLENAVKLLISEGGGGGSSLGPVRWPPADWFYGADRRPGKLKTLEGKAMPKLAAAQWSGEPVTVEECADRIVVLHFLSPGNTPSMKQGEALAALEKELGPQGVLFVGVCLPSDPLDEVKKLAGDKKLPSRLCIDAKLTSAKPNSMEGSLAAAFGVRYLPCTVVIDRGGMVRSAGVRVDKVKEMAGKLLAEKGKPTEGDVKTEK